VVDATAGARLARRAVVAAAVVSVALLAGVGLLRGSGPGSAHLPRADRVVIVSVPGLRWDDLAAVDAPNLDALAAGSALLSVRSIGTETSLLEGYLALGAGNRLDAARPGALDVVAQRCVPDLVVLADGEADDELTGAEAGALGTALRAAGRSTATFGSPDTLAALMDDRGCVGARGAASAATFDADVTLVELGGLRTAQSAAERSSAIRSIDEQLGRLAPPANAAVVLVAPAATGDRGEVLVAGARDLPGIRATGQLVSASTRRAGYVQLIDVAPTVLDLLGIEAPDAMSGTPWQVSGVGTTPVTARAAHLADLADRVAFRDRAVGPVSVILVVLTALCGLAGLAGRARVARGLAPIVAAYLSIAFLTGLVAYDELPLDFVVVAIPVLAALVAAVVVGATSRWGAHVPVTVLLGALWAVLAVDVVTGGRLQINTPLGYSPTVAGRFQGLGNLASGLVAAAALVVAVAPAATRLRRVPAAAVPWWAAWVGGVTLVVVAAPAFGSDVGGTLAVAPAFAGLLAVLTSRRIGVRRALLVLGATVALVVALAFVDLARPASSRTHLGRFLHDLLHGDGGLIIRRKLHGNLAILTSSFWSPVLVVALVVLAAIAWRRRAQVRRALEGRLAVRAFLAGFAIVAVLGFALNDSGLAVPAVMLNVAIPWLVVTMLPPVPRAGR
jgi:hypothetical protein